MKRTGREREEKEGFPCNGFPLFADWFQGNVDVLLGNKNYFPK